MNKTIIITASAAAVLGIAGISWGITSMNSAPAPVASSESAVVAEEITVEEVDVVEETASELTSTEEMLLYLIEEEKLAHDVYTVLADMWGSNVFSNILESETTHQNQVLSLLDTYGLTDPRSSELGVFVDPELQALYDSLIAQGSVSQTAAFEVGVLIEETDIADLSAAMATTDDPTIINTLQNLLNASQSHLQAFQGKL